MRRFAIASFLPVVALLLAASLVGAEDMNSQSDDPSYQPVPAVRIPLNSCTYDVLGTLGSGSSTYPGSSGLQIGRLNRNGISSTCAAAKTCSIFTSAGNRAYDSYAFTNATGHTSCVSVQLNVSTQTGCNLQANAYLGSYDPTNICTNYLADPGLSSGTPPTPTSFSFNLPAGATVVIVVHTTNPGEIGCNYELLLDGDICGSVPVDHVSWGTIKTQFRD